MWPDKLAGKQAEFADTSASDLLQVWSFCFLSVTYIVISNLLEKSSTRCKIPVVPPTTTPSQPTKNKKKGRKVAEL